MASETVFRSVVTVPTRSNKIKVDVADIAFGNLNPKAMDQRGAIGPFEAIDAKSISGGNIGAACLKAIATYDAMPHPSFIAPFD